MDRSYTSKNTAKLSMFFSANDDFELDKREVITVLKKSTQNLVENISLTTDENAMLNKFNDIEEYVDNKNTEETNKDSKEIEEVKEGLIMKSPPSPKEIEFKPEQEGEKCSSNTPVELDTLVNIEEIFIDNNGEQVLTNRLSGKLIVDKDKETVRIYTTVNAIFDKVEKIRQSLLAELPDMTTYLASNGRKEFKSHEEKKRLEYELEVSINRFRHMLGMERIEKSTRTKITTQIQKKIEIKSTMPYLTASEIAEFFFKEILKSDYPKLLLDVDGFVLNIAGITSQKEKRRIFAGIEKECYVVKCELNLYLGKVQEIHTLRE